jgi:hypothetical protein
VRWEPSCAWKESILASASMYMRVLRKWSAIVLESPNLQFSVSLKLRPMSQPHIHPHAITHPFGKLNSKSFCAPSEKLATLNQLTPLLPFSSLEPVLTPMAYLITSRPVEVGLTEGVSASLPMSCIFASERGVVVEKARALARGRAVRRENIVVVWCVLEMVVVFLGVRLWCCWCLEGVQVLCLSDRPCLGCLGFVERPLRTNARWTQTQTRDSGGPKLHSSPSCTSLRPGTLALSRLHH